MKSKTYSKKSPTRLVWLLLFGFILFASCSVTRRTTVESSYVQRGDTAVSITTKTVEIYDARKNNPLN